MNRFAGPVPSAAPSAGSTIINPSAVGVISTLASTAPSCMPPRRGAEPVAHLGVDEKSFRKRHRYVTIVNDLDRPRVLFVAEGRRKASLDGFWETLSEEQLASVEAVAMDMWDPYVASTREHLPESDKKIVYDKYHIAAHLSRPWIRCGGRRTNVCGRRATSV